MVVLTGTLLIARPTAGQEPGALHGSILDATSFEPIVGAEVSVPGTDIVGITDPDGLFVFEGISAGPVQIRVRSEGYSSGLHQIDIESGAATFVQFGITRISAVLDELAVRAGRMPSTSGLVRSSDSPAAGSAADLLAQRVPGVVVERGTGALGGGVTIRIRGVSSITSGREPAILLDGVRLNPSRAPDISLRTTPGLQILDEIPASQVSSIRVLRGSSAAAAYGESADGVILIETNVGAERSGRD